MIKILYVHGFEGNANGSSSKMIETQLTRIIPKNGFKLYAPQFHNDISKINENVRKIQEFSNRVDIIIASSFGSFLTLISEVPNNKILINPALLPYTELVNLGIIKQENPQSGNLSWYENNISKYIGQENAWYIISKYDSVIGPECVKEHLKLLKSKNIKPTILNSSEHKLSENSVNTIVDIIADIFLSNLNESDIQYHTGYNVFEDSDIRDLYESTIYCTSLKEKKRFVDILVPIIADSYSAVGGFAGGDNSIKNELLASGVFFRVETNDKNEPLLVQAYKGNKNFRKAFMFGTDKSKPESLNAYKKLFADNLKNIKKYGYYVEASGAPEYIFETKFKFPKVPNTQVEKYFKLMKPDIKLELDSDGYHYSRTINGQKHKKVMFGVDPYEFLKNGKIKTY